MKGLPFLLVALAVVFACTDTSPNPVATDDPELVVSFGFEPTPFYPSATNELYAVVQHLEVVEGQVMALCVPPDPCKQIPEQPIEGRLGAMANELEAMDGKVQAALDVANPPDPCVPPEPCFELKTAAIAAYGGATNILIAAREAKMGFVSMPFYPSIEPAFLLVEERATAIQTSILSSPFCQSAAGVPNLCLPDALPGY